MAVCTCSLPDFNPGIHLRNLSRLLVLSLDEPDLHNFDIPNTWGRLDTLQLKCNKMTRLPGNLTALRSLVFLTMEDQEADLQITEPLDFVTQLKRLEIVHLCESSRYPWNDASQYALMVARLQIRDTKQCWVELSA